VRTELFFSSFFCAYHHCYLENQREGPAAGLVAAETDLKLQTCLGCDSSSFYYKRLNCFVKSAFYASLKRLKY
jgi:hypothetical protein